MADTRQAMAEEEFFSTMNHKGCVLECHFTPLCNRSGKAVGAIGVATDVTKQVQNEAHYRGLFENAPTSLWEEDLSAVKAYITNFGARASMISKPISTATRRPWPNALP